MSPGNHDNDDSWLTVEPQSKELKSAKLASIIRWRDSTEKARPASSSRKNKNTSATFLDESDPPNFDPSWTSWLESPTPEPAEIRQPSPHKQQQHRQVQPPPHRSSSAPTPMMDVQYSNPPLMEPQRCSQPQHDDAFAVQAIEYTRATTLYTMYESSSTHTQPPACRAEFLIQPDASLLRRQQQAAAPNPVAGVTSRSHAGRHVRHEGSSSRNNNNTRKRGREGRLLDQPGCKRSKER